MIVNYLHMSKVLKSKNCVIFNAISMECSLAGHLSFLSINSISGCIVLKAYTFMRKHVLLWSNTNKVVQTQKMAHLYISVIDISM